ncbi:hypothetical protein MtrunA17_Chr6g0484001 [Medicago truncatula]|uniref:Uncharacterized protein n=1 Tax=Medicago truncatula TaxID=3880 RepID=A0A396HJJ9_MEDTR|nr:hypothetical protein MtrunA17_Chr6g0484001 [Medicago truncatula]
MTNYIVGNKFKTLRTLFRQLLLYLTIIQRLQDKSQTSVIGKKIILFSSFSSSPPQPSCRNYSK